MSFSKQQIVLVIFLLIIIAAAGIAFGAFYSRTQSPATQQTITAADSVAVSGSDVSSQPETMNPQPAGDVGSENPNPAPTTGDRPSTAAKILSRGVIKAGVKYDFKPFGFVDDSGQISGFDVDIVREFARRWLGDENAVEFIKVTSSSRIPMLVSGEVDLVAASMTHKRERDELIDFSQTYFLDGQSLLVRADSGIQGLLDLNGKSVAAIQGSTSIDNIQAAAERQGLIIQVVSFQEYPAAVEALKTGQVAALTSDSVALTQFAQDNPGLTVVGGRFTQEPYGIGVPEGDSYFREMVNFTLQEMKKDGTYDALYRKWFPGDEPYAVEIAPGEWPYTFSSLPAQLTLPERSQIQRILERGRIVVGVQANLPPFAAPGDNGQLTGFDVAIVKEFARRWLGDENALELVLGAPEDHITSLVGGQLDLIASALVKQREWADIIDFSQAYVGPPAVPAFYGIGLPQNDSKFRELVDFTLQEMKSDGTYDKLYTQWFGSDVAPFALETVPGSADYLLVPYVLAGETDSTGPRISSAGESVIARIRKRNNVMVVGVKYDFKPFGFLNENGQVVGFDVDLVRAMADEWGVTVQFVQVTSSDRIQKLVGGDVDMVAASMTHTKARDEQIDFSQTYFLDGQSLLVRRDSGITGIRGLDGRTVAAIQGSTSIDQIRAHADANGVDITILPFQEYPPALEALKAGQIDALTTDSVALSQFAKDNPDLVVVGGLFTQEPYGMGLPSGDSYFNNLVNFTLQSLKQRGVYDQLYRKWFGEESTPYNIEIQPGNWPYTFSTSPTTLDRPVRSKVDDILANGKFVAGVKFDFKPFGFLDEQNQVVGFDIDIVQEFAKRWLGDANAVELVQVTSANRIQKLVAGEVDLVAASMTHKRERDELIDFSQTYFLDGQSLLVRSDSGIKELTDLDGKVVAAIQGSTSIDNIQLAARRLGITLEVLPFQEYPPALEALKVGQVDALTTDSVALSQFAKDNPGLSVVGGRFTSEPYGMGLPSYDDRFQDLVNFTLQEMKLDGTYDRIYRKWFGEDQPYAVEVWPGESYLDVNMIPMLRVPAGEFIRGTNDGFPDEQPEQVVTVDDFYIDQYEVTNRQYDRCVRDGKCALPALPRSVNFGRYYAESAFRNYPVIWVTWDDAAAYCRYAGKRLPTEAEWEKAARGVDGFMYPWGNQPPTDQANFNYLYKDVASVGFFQQDVSPFGAYDMAGNVREWVADWYQWDYYTIAPDHNPKGPETGVTRVLKGGAWNDVAQALRATTRKNFLPESYDSNLGFRCASSVFPPSR